MRPILIDIHQLNKEIIEYNVKSSILNYNIFLVLLFLFIVLVIVYFNKNISKKQKLDQYLNKLKYIQNRSTNLINNKFLDYK